MKALGEQASRRYFVTAERFNAAEAHRLGLVHEVVTADSLDAKVDALLAAITANG
ncbi:enoyl-CoA hydratase-related protein, partial [Pseudomonas putida]|uniref:enoyl-CoA hydratase-related protein n=1 Tax=Pseudomonas putida TaxID=303 RepID=UPI0038FC77CF